MDLKERFYEEERAAYARASVAELKAVERALRLHAWGNDRRDRARLLAVRDLLAEKGRRT
jgi:hypothetical protein